MVGVAAAVVLGAAPAAYGVVMKTTDGQYYTELSTTRQFKLPRRL